MSIDNVNGCILGLEPVSVTKSSLEISIDPRMELLSIVQFLSSYDSRYNLLTKYNIQYKKQIEERFSRLKRHYAVEIFESMSAGECTKKSSSFSYDAPPATMLYVKNDFSLSTDIFKKEALVKKAGGEKALFAFIGALHEFALESGFNKFYRCNKSFYEQTVNAAAQKIDDKNYVYQLESFYGVRHKGYTIILVPLFHCGGFGSSIEDSDGTRHIFSITGPLKIQNDLPEFGSKNVFDNLQQHEFSHSFVNPITDKYWDEAKKYSHIYDLIDNEAIRQSYGNWRSVLNEHVIRAVTTRFAYAESPDEGDKALELEKNRGFKYVDLLLNKIIEYEENRDRFPTFESFYLELISVFKSLTS